MAGIIGLIVVIAALMALDKVKASYYAKKLDEAAQRNPLDNAVDLEKGIIRYGGKDFFLNMNEDGRWDQEIFTSGKFRRMMVYGNILHHSWLIAGISGCIAFVFIKLAPQETLAFIFGGICVLVICMNCFGSMVRAFIDLFFIDSNMPKAQTLIDKIEALNAEKEH
ncbi:MAG: hypothetical protein ABF747_01470 [Bifidobacterium sp.]|uniref:Uncharacterized protein n=1 Tax=Bifidobacterium fermentum TaxID=3059035 RepID=A0AB39UDG8_9BIFI